MIILDKIAEQTFRGYKKLKQLIEEGYIKNGTTIEIGPILRIGDPFRFEGDMYRIELSEGEPACRLYCENNKATDPRILLYDNPFKIKI